MSKFYMLILIPMLGFSDIDHATIVNEIKVDKSKNKGAGLATVEAEISFNVAPGSYHPHYEAINVKSITIQGKQLGDGSWKLYSVGDSCLGQVKIGEQLRIKGEINKKIHIFCKRSNLKQ